MRLGGMRKDQALMNSLRRVAPELYEMVTGTSVDYFYRDDRITQLCVTLGVRNLT